MGPDDFHLNVDGTFLSNRLVFPYFSDEPQVISAASSLHNTFADKNYFYELMDMWPVYDNDTGRVVAIFKRREQALAYEYDRKARIKEIQNKRKCMEHLTFTAGMPDKRYSPHELLYEIFSPEKTSS